MLNPDTVPPNIDVGKITEIFLISASILVTALGVAQTEGLKTGISALALILTTLWAICACNAGADSAPAKILIWMPALFLVCWIVSFVFHGRRYYAQHKKTEAQTPKPVS